jgi:CubicO group peptidase (beta-lactamase class C family)
MTHRSRHRITLVLAALALVTWSPAKADDLRARIDGRIEQEITDKRIVGLSAGLYRAGAPLETLHFGWEDREAQTPASDKTMYRWASISKPLTAVIAVQLARENKLDLDLDVCSYVPEFPAREWPLTARQLLCHQGGVVHYTNGEVTVTVRTYDDPHPFKDVVVALDRFKESPLIAEPGTKYSYTTHGYILLGAVVQRAGERPYADLVTMRIAEPLGMTTLRPDYQWEDIPHSAVGYRRNRADEIVRSTDTDVSWKLPGGGFISNVADLTRFGAGMLELKIVDEAMREAMWTPQVTRDGEATTYGLGFGIGELDGRRIAAHSGSQEKTATYLLIDAEAGHVVALMCNTEGARLNDLARDLARMMHEANQQSTSPESVR